MQGDTGLLGILKVQGFQCEETNNWKIQNRRQKKWILIYQQNSVLQKNGKKLSKFLTKKWQRSPEGTEIAQN